MEHLLEACYKFDTNEVKSLLDKWKKENDDMDKNIKDIFGRISQECFNKDDPPVDKQIELIDVLVENGADINVRDKTGHAIIHYACLNPDEQTSLLPRLISVGADIDIQVEKSGFTPLHICTRHQNVFEDYKVIRNNVKLLVKSGANVRLQDDQGKTALHYLVVSQHNESTERLAELILQKGADINTTDKKSQAPLHVSHYTQVIRGQVITSAWDEFLLLQGGNTNIRDMTYDKELPMERRFNSQMFFRGMNLFNAMGSRDSAPVFPDSLRRILVLNLKAGLDMRQFSVDLLFSVINELLRTGNLLVMLVLAEAGAPIYTFQGPYSNWPPHISHFIKLLNAYVLPLKRLAANAIRTRLKPNALQGVDKLELPRSINDYIVLKEFSLSKC